ncbi:MAG: hypothetical protein KC431_27475, partial [Myxococcales bacterium]|nr:hypothetical protein [Myxococcales bacterium]
RLMCWMVAGVAPGLGFTAISWTLVDVLTRNSLLGPAMAWIGAVVILLAAFAHAAAVARIWYEGLRGESRGEHADEADGLDVGPLLLILVVSLGLGLMALVARFGLVSSPLAWLDLALPLAGGHEGAPLGLRADYRDGIEVARPWLAGGAALVALLTGFAWMWARERFRRADGGDLSTWTRALESVFVAPQLVRRVVILLSAGLAELAARGVGRGLFEEGPGVLRRLALGRMLTDALRSRSGSRIPAARLAMLGTVAGALLLLGWLYAKPEVSSLLPADDYGFGGLRPKLIRAGGPRESGAGKDGGAAPAGAEPAPAAAFEASEPAADEPEPEEPRTITQPTAPEVPR